ncbi:MAG: hypothetical protein H0W70_08210 [Actinobacteria bacterium]|nr:hypothetical protein [Actinomycetota bacterium]
MTRRHAVLASIGALLLAGTAPAAFAAEGDPATITEVGWWSATPGAAEPAGGFQVSQSPNGDATAVAGIKIKVDVSGIQTALLVITEGATKFGELSADIVICSAASTWQGANPGALRDAPARDCSRASQLRRSDNLQSWSANVAPLLSPPVTTLLLKPGPQRNGAMPLPSLEYLPQVPTPVAAPTPIPPPLPPAAIDVIRPLNLPTRADLPAPIGFQVQFAGEQLAALPPDSASGGGTLSGSDALPGFNTGSSGLGDLSAAGPVVGVEGTASSAGVVPTQEGSAVKGLQLAGEGRGRPWGRIWLLALVAGAVGAGSAWARRKVALRGG